MIKFIVHKSTMIFLGTVLIVIAGIFAYMDLPRESAPEVKQPYVFITTAYPGVGATDIEYLVTEVIEEELSTLDGLTELTSSSQQSLSFIFAEFSSDITVETALRRVQQRVDRAVPLLPQDIDEPVVEELSSSDFPLLVFTLSNPQGIKILDQSVTDLEERLKRVRGVLDIEIAGRSDKEIRIELDPRKMYHYGFSIENVTTAVQNANVAIPGGILKNEARTYIISVNSEIKEIDVFNNIVVFAEGVSAPLSEIADVNFTYSDPETYSRVNGQPAITLSLTKRSGENIIEIVENVMSIVDSMAAGFPDGTRIDYIYDESDYIRQIIVDLENNMFSGFVLVLLVTILFLGFVNSLFISLAIPLSMLMSFSILQLLGITLNMVVLFSLILALGMLVDNGIVIVENIFRHGTMGKSQTDAAIDGTSEVALPIITSTITTCLAFLPVVFMPDVMGDFLSYIPITVIIVLLSSLFVALIINPVFCSRFLKIKSKKSRSKIAGNNKFYLWLVDFYGKWLERIISHAGILIAASFAFVISGFVLYLILGKETIFFPSLDPSEIIVNAELPQGTPLEKTDKVIENIETIVNEVPSSMKIIQTVSGRAGSGDFFSGVGEEFNKGYVRLSLKPFQEREIKGASTVLALNDSLSDFPGAVIKIVEQESGPPSGNDISYEIIGDQYDIMGLYADSILMRLKDIKELKLVETNYEPEKPELNVFVDRRKAHFYNLSMQQIASSIRTAINGTEIGKYRVGGEEYDVVLRYGDTFRSSISDVNY
ncbi:MAG: efflux RND transporter permease subunit, partial [Fibrobacter sp.]|nr:efflux RND transporter permease subunit [Fibrobacter sp.]